MIIQTVLVHVQIHVRMERLHQIIQDVVAISKTVLMAQYHGLTQDVYALVLTLVKMELHLFLKPIAAVKILNVGMECNQIKCLTVNVNNVLISVKMEILQILQLVAVKIQFVKMEV